MAWTPPITWTNTLSDPDDWNEQIQDNLLALKQPPTEHYQTDQGADYSTTSSTYAPVDGGADLSFTFETNGGDILIGFTGTAFISAGNGLLDVSVDGTRIANNTNGGIRDVFNANLNASFCRWVRGLPGGVHTLTLEFKRGIGATPFIIYAGAGTANFDLHTRFWVRELS